MIVHYWLLPLALILLWFPRQWLRNGAAVIPTPKFRRRVVKDHDPRDLSLRWREEFFKFRNWVDVFRGMIGSWAVMQGCFDMADDAPKSIGPVILLVQAVVLLIAVLIQTMRYERREGALVAPVFFVMGMGFGLVGWLAALFACIMAWTLHRALPSAGFFLCVLAGLQACFGILLSTASPVVAVLAVGLSITPVMLAMATHRRLERVSRWSSGIR